MTDDLLESYIAQHIDAAAGSPANFTWHGGEPTLLGLDYFRKIVALQKKHKPSGAVITNNIQTNGTLIDEAWCRFFSKEGFTVGLSLDGPREIHDLYRHTVDGKSAYEQVMHGYELLRHHRVPCDILCVVHAENVRYAARVYRFFKEIGAEYLGFIPLVEPGHKTGEVGRRTVPAKAWGEFLCTVFDEWLSHDIGKVKVQIFEEVARTALGHPHALCIFREECGDCPAVEHNGEFFSCDHFVDPEHRIGNIDEATIAELLEKPEQRAFGKSKSRLPRYCRECAVLNMCHGGCPKDRIIETPDGEPGLNYLCDGYKLFFNHCRSFAEQLAIQSRAQRVDPQTRPLRAPPHAPPQVMHNRSHPKVGRNDPCPCGSGRKYKNCCLGK